MSTARQVRHCARCGRRIAPRSGMALCEVCTYADEVGREAAERQTQLADAERLAQSERRKAGAK